MQQPKSKLQTFPALLGKFMQICNLKSPTFPSSASRASAESSQKTLSDTNSTLNSLKIIFIAAGSSNELQKSARCVYGRRRFASWRRKSLILCLLINDEFMYAERFHHFGGFNWYWWLHLPSPSPTPSSQEILLMSTLNLQACEALHVAVNATLPTIATSNRNKSFRIIMTLALQMCAAIFTQVKTDDK